MTLDGFCIHLFGSYSSKNHLWYSSLGQSTNYALIGISMTYYACQTFIIRPLFVCEIRTGEPQQYKVDQPKLICIRRS